LGSRLQVKPILTAEAEMRAVERVRTTERAFERLVDLAHRMHAAGADYWIVQHAGVDEAAHRLAVRAEKIFRRPAAFMSQFSPVIGTHGGPAALMLAGIDPVWLDAGAGARTSSDLARSSTAPGS
jgi:fatty acid-binding protein DegV